MKQLKKAIGVVAIACVALHDQSRGTLHFAWQGSRSVPGAPPRQPAKELRRDRHILCVLTTVRAWVVFPSALSGGLPRGSGTERENAAHSPFQWGSAPNPEVCKA